MDPVQQQAAVNKVLEELVRVLPRRVEMAHKDLFPTWEAFLDTFTRVGGVIEAVSFFFLFSLGFSSCF